MDYKLMCAHARTVSFTRCAYYAMAMVRRNELFIEHELGRLKIYYLPNLDWILSTTSSFVCAWPLT